MTGWQPLGTPKPEMRPFNRDEFRSLLDSLPREWVVQLIPQAVAALKAQCFRNHLGDPWVFPAAEGTLECFKSEAASVLSCPEAGTIDGAPAV